MNNHVCLSRSRIVESYRRTTSALNQQCGSEQMLLSNISTLPKAIDWNQKWSQAQLKRLSGCRKRVLPTSRIEIFNKEGQTLGNGHTRKPMVRCLLKWSIPPILTISLRFCRYLFLALLANVSPFVLGLCIVFLRAVNPVVARKWWSPSYLLPTVLFERKTKQWIVQGTRSNNK